ncbi:MAG: PLP-dependent transferase [Sediminibacterium sp. Gen4]|jgi:cystathionine beta-lyase/cystathionine gamma-synthase|uniref:trans-sulfuration enzyme family protein n=1 Tax=unclassified Sediminibacterium TaxID=2635961 RepID=UPI0015BB369D|nr:MULTISPECIES: PLP-dependent aspartate aminotransferase family protein [unclassified Sediminibacterium]MBW0160126.1 PLP-dependent aspartate aminotransferase family protein [Sediminibacterium sp.]MBW0163623.1 PLP-dependent aspartate aminotransferase family protein [Sediminibacterium sp.]NWK66452.1 PLP-dependent transferase [Sediminibacterium sp. Gen4]
MDISYILNELGEDRDEYFRAVSPPIVQTSNFAFKTVDDLRKAFENEYGGWLYSRGLNPTVEILRKKLAALDGAEDCLVFNSGAAAIFASVLANVKAGDHIVSVKDPYTWARKMFDEILPRFGVTVTYIDGRSIVNFENAIQSNTTVIYLESPNSWMFDLQDLSAVAQLARSKNIVTICDNSFCTPLYQKPYEMGIDLVLQSATKYISGHSDVVAGVLSGSRKQIERIFNSEYNNIGSGIQPFNAWLLIRGLRTLPARLERITRTTQTVIDFLLSHPRVEEVIFPLHPSFPQYELAQRQMNGGCGLLTFTIKTQSCETIEKFCNSLKHILMAVSWGGHESLIIPKCAGLQRADFNAGLALHRSLRLYVGLEEPDYIIADLEQAFDVIKDLS